MLRVSILDISASVVFMKVALVVVADDADLWIVGLIADADVPFTNNVTLGAIAGNERK